MESSVKNIVIIGGGGCGIEVARSLSKILDPSLYNITLVTRRTRFIHNPAMIRVLVDSVERLEEKALIPYDRLFVKGNGTLVQGEVSSIEPLHHGEGGSVILSNGHKINYNYLVLAPGSIWVGPLAFPDGFQEIIEHINHWRQKFKEAKEICIVGGGAVGIELAGELRDLYTDKKITLIHSNQKLLNDTYPNKFRDLAKRGLDARNIQLILDDIVEDETSTTTSRKKLPITADLMVPAWGAKPNTDFIASLEAFHQSDITVLNGKGYVRTRPTLQLYSYPNIFAGGDVLDWNEQKGVVKYPAHASIIVNNILSLMKADGKSTMKEYKGSIEALFLTNGNQGGCGYFGVLWGIIVGNWVVWLLKCRGLFFHEYWHKMGY